MKRIFLASVVLLLALPGSALAAGRSGVVLSVNPAKQLIQVVDGGHVVHAYRYRGRLAGVRAGSRISFQLAGGRISRVRIGSARSRTVSFYARVLRSSRAGLSLRLGDGNDVKFAAGQVKHAPTASASGSRHPPIAHVARSANVSRSVSIAIQGLEPGVTVLVTESVDGSGNVVITITLPASVAGVGGAQQASGVVGDVSSDSFVLATADGSELRLHAAPSLLAGLNLRACDTVLVTYHQAAQRLIADTVQSTGSSTSGDCSDSTPAQHVAGTITQVSAGGLTISSDHGAVTFTVASSDITAGFQPGDLVDVTYSQNNATDVEYVEQDASGTVRAVSAGSITITAGSQTKTFAADPSQGMFDGIAVGDQVGVVYHQSSGQLVADSVDDGS
jgi:hypothetical protein